MAQTSKKLLLTDLISIPLKIFPCFLTGQMSLLLARMKVSFKLEELKLPQAAKMTALSTG